MKKAKQFLQQLEISRPCEFSSRWLHKFKLRQGIYYLKTRGEKLSTDKEDYMIQEELIIECLLHIFSKYRFAIVCMCTEGITMKNKGLKQRQWQ